MPETRNIIDYYHYWKTDAIKADLDTKRHPFAVLVSNLQNDFNIGTVVRNANAFLSKEVIVYGRKHWDRRGAVGTQNYESFSHVRTADDLDSISGYTWVAIDNIDGAVPMDSYEWPDNSLLCFGQEQIGLPGEVISRCKDIVYIQQFGSVRSLNVGCASAIAMYDWTSKNARL